MALATIRTAPMLDVLRRMLGLTARDHRILERLEASVSDLKSLTADLTAEVARQTTVTASVKALLSTFIAAATPAVDEGNIDAIRAALADLKANDDALAQAVVDNTPQPSPTPASGTSDVATGSSAEATAAAGPAPAAA